MKDVYLAPIVMVENKIDLVGEREVPKGAGEMAAKALGCLFVSYALHSLLTPALRPPHNELSGRLTLSLALWWRWAVGGVATGRAPRHERESTTCSTAQSNCAWPCALNSIQRGTNGSRGVHPGANAVCSPDAELVVLYLMASIKWTNGKQGGRHLREQAS
jgi:hypothetical protein